MTAPLPPNADELVSAYVDGEAAPDEIALVENSTDLMAMVAAQRSIAAAIAAPLDVSPALKEVHIGGALDEFDRLIEIGEIGNEPGSPVVSLEAARERRRPKRLNVLAAAAAAIAVLFAGIVAVGLNAGTSRDVVDGASAAIEDTSGADTSVSTESQAVAADHDSVGASEDTDDAPASEEEANVAAAGAVAGESAPAEAPAADEQSLRDTDLEEAAEEEPAEAEGDANPDPTPVPTLPPPSIAESGADAGTLDAEDGFVDGDEPDAAPDIHLGAITSIDEIIPRLASRLDPRSALAFAASLDPAPPTSCPDLVGELFPDSIPRLVATAELDSSHVEIHAVDDATIVVLDTSDCTVVAKLDR